MSWAISRGGNQGLFVAPRSTTMRSTQTKARYTATFVEECNVSVPTSSDGNVIAGLLACSGSGSRLTCDVPEGRSPVHCLHCAHRLLLFHVRLTICDNAFFSSLFLNPIEIQIPFIAPDLTGSPPRLSWRAVGSIRVRNLSLFF